MLLLLVEDNLADALLVREAIVEASLPIEVHLAKDGEEALSFIERAEADPAAPCPQAVVLDLNLPKLDGSEVLRRLRASQKCRSVPVLVVTSSASPSDRQLAADLGAGYFRKPVEFHEFMKIGGLIRAMLERNALLPA